MNYYSKALYLQNWSTMSTKLTTGIILSTWPSFLCMLETAWSFQESFQDFDGNSFWKQQLKRNNCTTNMQSPAHFVIWKHRNWHAQYIYAVWKKFEMVWKHKGVEKFHWKSLENKVETVCVTLEFCRTNTQLQMFSNVDCNARWTKVEVSFVVRLMNDTKLIN